MSTQSDLIAINANVPVQAPFRASYPLQITALDSSSNQPLLYITGDAGRTLQVTVKNVSEQDYVISAPADTTPSDSNYHLAIYFRPGTFSTETLGNIKAPLSNLAMTCVQQTGGIDVLYILYTDSSTNLTLNAGDDISFSLESVTADGTMGARSTKVEYGYRNLQPTPGGTPLSGTVSQVMQVINAEGVDVSPFYFGVYGSNTILNDGATSNTIQLILAAAGQNDVPITGSGTAQTTFELGFVESSSNQNIPWTLCPDGTINSSSIDFYYYAADPNDWNKTTNWTCEPNSTEGDRTLFQITTTDPSIAAGQPVIIQITGITSNSPDGISPVTLNFYNVPGYWDGQVQCSLVKTKDLTLPYPAGETSTITIGNPVNPNKYYAGLFINQQPSAWAWPLQILDSSGTSVFSVNCEGNVGIGTLSSDNNLEVNGKANISGDVTIGGATTLNAGASVNGDATISGKVGIGCSTTPDTQVSLPYPTNGTNGLLIGDSQASENFAGLFITIPPNATVSSTASPFQIYSADNNTSLFQVNPLGVVEIGPKSSSRGQIDISSSINNSIKDYGWLNGGTGATTTVDSIELHVGNFVTTNTNLQFSIWASDNIAASEFDAFSDARIKEIRGPSDSASDLATLNKIQITDYRHKDRAQYGDRPHKKVIGQQVAEVFPQAISTHTDVVPDILAKSTMENGSVALEGNTLRKGEKVRILFESSQPELLEVLESTDQGFTVDSKKSGEVVIYGREVDDFHNVDYDAISMLNVSATQELHKLIQQQAELLKEQGAMIRELQVEVRELKRGAVGSVQ